MEDREAYGGFFGVNHVGGFVVVLPVPAVAGSVSFSKGWEEGGEQKREKKSFRIWKQRLMMQIRKH